MKANGEMNHTTSSGKNLPNELFPLHSLGGVINQATEMFLYLSAGLVQNQTLFLCSQCTRKLTRTKSKV